ncbi:hypothetical protein [Streptomyces sp. NPDC058424]|uniref:hypothetical protein n=1 Tax=Streptomyces sp. NPDC058424 TaxID=3346491 RepID=UPI0036540C6A
MLLRLAYLTVTNAFAVLRLLPMSDRDKDAEILALRHQITVLERQLGGEKVRFSPSDPAFLAALLHRFPSQVLRRIRWVVRPDTVLRWHRDLISHRHAARSRPGHPGRPRTIRSIRLLVLRLARENSHWGYRRIHGELLVLGVTVAPSTVWEILREAGLDPAPERATSTWADFLRSQADALLACDFLETVTMSGARLYVFAVIEHASRRIYLDPCIVEDSVEQGGKLPVPVPDQEPGPAAGIFEVHDEVLRGLSDPRGGGVRGGAEDAVTQLRDYSVGFSAETTGTRCYGDGCFGVGFAGYAGPGVVTFLVTVRRTLPVLLP